MPQQHAKQPPVPTQEVSHGIYNAATIALLEQWERTDATDDVTAISEAERQLAEFKASLNANRPPDRAIFP